MGLVAWFAVVQDVPPSSEYCVEVIGAPPVVPEVNATSSEPLPISESS
jgi:hypothetical protein